MKSFELLRPTSAEAAARALGDRRPAEGRRRRRARPHEGARRRARPRRQPRGRRARTPPRIARDGDTIRIGAGATLAAIAASDRRYRPPCARRPSRRPAGRSATSPRSAATSASTRAAATTGSSRSRASSAATTRVPCSPTAPSRRRRASSRTAPAPARTRPAWRPRSGTAGAVLHVVGAQRARGRSRSPISGPRREQGRASDTTLAPDRRRSPTSCSTRAMRRPAGASRTRRSARRPPSTGRSSPAPSRSASKDGKVAEASVWLGRGRADAPAQRGRRGGADGEGRSTRRSPPRRARPRSGEATPLDGTRYKVQLVKVAVRRALAKAWGRS